MSANWQPRPVTWAVETTFADSLTLVPTSEEFELQFRASESADITDLCARMTDKLTALGIAARVSMGISARDVVVSPAATSECQVIEFCQMMLKILERRTYVFGKDELVGGCVHGRANWGICSCDSDRDWSSVEERVFVSKHVGALALLDGLVHHGVF